MELFSLFRHTTVVHLFIDHAVVGLLLHIKAFTNTLSIKGLSIGLTTKHILTVSSIEQE